MVVYPAPREHAKGLSLLELSLLCLHGFWLSSHLFLLIIPNWTLSFLSSLFVLIMLVVIISHFYIFMSICYQIWFLLICPLCCVIFYSHQPWHYLTNFLEKSNVVTHHAKTVFAVKIQILIWMQMLLIRILWCLKQLYSLTVCQHLSHLSLF